MQKTLALLTAVFFFAVALSDSASANAHLSDPVSVQNADAAAISPKPFSRYNKPLTQYALSQWNTRDGLPHNSVNSITQSENGYLWLATWEGPVRFDGRSFTVFDNVAELQVPELGVVGIAHDASTDEIYISGLRGGVSRFNGERWQGLPLAPSFAFRVLVDAEQNVWVTASNAGLVRYDREGNMHRYQQADGLPGNFTYHLYESPATDVRSREIWVGTGSGLARYDSNTDQFVAIPSVASSQVRAVLQHSNGMLLVASDQGLFYQNKPGTDFLPWPRAIEGTITSLEEGPDGAIWFGTISHGLGRITDSNLSTLSIENGLPNIHVLDIFRDRENNMWVSTHGGLLQLRDALFTSFTRTQGLVGNYVRAVMTDQQDRLWVGTNEGLG
ncbi:ligand-binding sensor domain-containing protein [Aliidiomarina iranensis]|nr:two-component regulator propeller domain-containing protein [Aliidiomarina iranensis]